MLINLPLQKGALNTTHHLLQLQLLPYRTTSSRNLDFHIWSIHKIDHTWCTWVIILQLCCGLRGGNSRCCTWPDPSDKSHIYRIADRREHVELTFRVVNMNRLGELGETSKTLKNASSFILVQLQAKNLKKTHIFYCSESTWRTLLRYYGVISRKKEKTILKRAPYGKKRCIFPAHVSTYPSHKPSVGYCPQKYKEEDRL